MSETQEAHALEPVAGDVLSTEVPPADGGGTPPPDTPTKHRSGFSRQKAKVARLTELYSNLQDDYEGLLVDHDRLERDYRAIEAAYSEVCQLNATLADELRQLKSQQQRPSPVRYGMGLMGV